MSPDPMTNGAPPVEARPSNMREALVELAAEEAKIFVRMSGGGCSVGVVVRVTMHHAILISAGRDVVLPIRAIVEVRRCKGRGP